MATARDTQLVATIGLFAAIFAAIPRHVAGQDLPSLGAATELKCSFSMVATGTWTKEGDVQADLKKSDLVVQYENVDSSDGSAQIKGYVGNLFITVRFVGGTLHLLATDAGGPVYMTTIFNRVSHEGKFKAVHTRHEFTDVSLPGFTSRPEQYYGECEILKSN